MIAWTRVHAISTVLIESDARRASTSPAKGKNVWEHSPTRRKDWEITRLNRGAQIWVNCVTAHPLLPGPHYTRWPSNCRPLLQRGAPHGCPRGPAWSRGLLPRGRALCASCTSRGPPTALPHGLSTASHPCGGPARHVSARCWARLPHQHLQVSNSLFCDFSKENINKNEIKNRKKA